MSSEPSPTLTPFDQIRQFCVNFSDEWEQGKSPKIEKYLSQAPAEQRGALLRNLLEIETENRRQRGDAPAADEWIERFPEYQAMICQLSLETCEFDIAGTHNSDNVSVAQTAMVDRHGAATARRLGNYRLVRELGRGAMGYVYEAVHLQRGEHVALKTLPLVDGRRLHLFKREFRALVNTSHPNLVSLNALESDGDQWFFTMELLLATSTFLEYVRPNGAVDEARLLDAFGQLTAGVSALHSAGIIHRDLKPANVMITDGAVKLLDFGLVKEIDQAHTQTAGKVMGTPAYMAPEQVEAEELTPAADWYAVGTMLYEALTGELPFSGNMLQLLMKKQSRDAPTELLSASTLPASLVDLCQALLKRNPRDRPDAKQIFSVVGPPPKDQQLTRASLDANGTQSTLLGRDSQLTALFRQFEKVQTTGLPSAIFVCGKSGEGKSALVDRFLTDLSQREEFTLLSGRCYDREFVPFKALDSLIDALAGFLRSLESVDAAILLPDDAGLLADVFPVLGRVEVIAKRPAPSTAKLDQTQVRNRAFAALRELLRRISVDSRLIMFSDDLQWGDADSAKVLLDVLSGADAPSILFIGSYRSDEASGSPFLNAWGRLHTDIDAADSRAALSGIDALEVVRVDVAPLTVEHCRQLVAEVIGNADDATSRRLGEELHQETGGNAFFLRELIELLDPESGSLQRVPLHSVIANKVSTLPQITATLLDVIAVSGKAMDVTELISVLDQDAGVYGTLGRMRNIRLVRTLGEEAALMVDTYHDKIRETVLDRMPQQRKRSLHVKLAAWIEESDGGICLPTIDRILAGEDVEHPNHDRMYDLSAHYLAGGDECKAAIYALLAAEQAQRQFSMEVALQQFETTYSFYRQGELEALGIRLLYGFAKCLLSVGDYLRCGQLLDEAYSLSPTDHQRFQMEETLGDAAFAKADLEEAYDHYLMGLRYGGQRVPRNGASRVLSLGAALAVHLIRDWIPVGTRRTAAEGDERVIRLYGKASNVGMFVSGQKALWPLLRGINFGERFSDNAAMARSYAMYSVGVATLGLQTRAAAYESRATKMVAESDDFANRAQVDALIGVSSFGQARHNLVEQSCNDSLAAFKRMGDKFFEAVSLFHLACAEYARGRLDEAIVGAHETFLVNYPVRGTRTNCATYLLQRASEGAIDLQPYMDRMTRKDADTLSTCNLDKAIGINCQTRQQTIQAIEHLERACQRPLAAWLPNFHAVAGLPLLIGALRTRHGELVKDNPRAAAKTLRRAWRLARQARWLCRFFPVEHSFALREYALVAELLGRHRVSLSFLEKSCALAEDQNATYELARSRHELARLHCKRKTPGAEEELASTEEALSAFRQLIRRGMERIAAIGFDSNSR